MKCLVAGASGFIGSALAQRLKTEGHTVVGVDIRTPEYIPEIKLDSFTVCDLRKPDDVSRLFSMETLGWGPFDEVYQLAADMGGMGYVHGKDAQILFHNSLINAYMLNEACAFNAKRYLFTSSACVYPEHLQMEGFARHLREDMAFPAQPQDGYGWEKLTAELACSYYRTQHGLATRVARLHNIYGPLGTWQGGREKSPAALCRKVAHATNGDEIEIWGDGKQLRSYCYIDDAVDGILAIMRSDHGCPFNIGSQRAISISDLADMIIKISGKRLIKSYTPGPEGVRSRTADTTRAEKMLNWSTTIPLEHGIATTYRWIESEIKRSTL